MAEFGGFFNSVGGDRKYKSEDFANYFKTFIGTGINPNTDSLRVVRVSNTQVKILQGSACVDGYLYLNSGGVIKNIENNATRIDRVVLRLDIVNRLLNILIIQGLANEPPKLTVNNSIHELSLAKIIINGTNLIIEDERGQGSLCPYMEFIGKDDLQSMWNKFNTEWGLQKNVWQDWFTNMQGKSIRGIYIQSGTPADAKVGDIWIELV